MMKGKIFETIVGAIVLLVAVLFIINIYKTTDLADHNDFNTYVIGAKFNRVDGLNLAADVKIGGVKVGKVIDLELDQKTYQAVIKMRISEKIELPVDTSAEIIGGSLLGDKYVSISPGVDDEKLGNNQYIQYTQSAVSLEGLIGKFMFSSAEKAAKNDTESQASIDRSAKPAIDTNVSK